MTCPHCQGAEKLFGDRMARRDLKQYRKRGVRGSTRLLLDALREEMHAAGVCDASLLDVGGGVGILYHELLAGAAREAVHVDASAAYIAAARDEADRRGETSRVRWVHGDFVDLAPGLPAADVVTLDRVVCCYPDMRRLVALSAERARRLYGAVFPRDRWWIRMLHPLANFVFRLQRSGFRIFLHEPAAIDATLRERGLERRRTARTIMWEVAVYRRAP
jgi:magnesium-protoporphyrin O-methyltransferase